jgi:hypothetical protein
LPTDRTEPCADGGLSAAVGASDHAMTLVVSHERLLRCLIGFELVSGRKDMAKGTQACHRV